MKKLILKLSLMGIASTALQTQLLGEEITDATLTNTTLNGDTVIEGAVQISDSEAPKAWTTAPVSPHWNLKLEDGLFIYGDGDSTPNLLNLDFDGTEGALMFWYPEKSAFRAGKPDPLSWDEVNIGEGSFAFGNGADAVGSCSTAWGLNTEATEYGSTAWGGFTKSKGYYSTTWGVFSHASGYYSTAWGAWTLAESYLSTAFGRNNIGGYYSSNGATAWDDDDSLLELGIGSSDTERANALTVMKDGTLLLGEHDASAILPLAAIETVQIQGPILIQDYAAAVDINTAATPGAIRYDSTSNDFEGYVAGDGWLSLTEAVGTSALVDSTGASVLSVDENGALVLSETTASDLQAQLLDPGLGTSLVFSDDLYNVVLGEAHDMRGSYSTALGWGHTVTPNAILAFVSGFENTVDSFVATAWGQYNTVSGQSSTVWGDYNTVTSGIATAWGIYNTVSSAASTAWGSHNTVTGNTATAWGHGNTASGHITTVWGIYNHAAAAYSTAFGRANIGGFTFSDDDDDTNDGDTVWFELDPLLEVGVGASNRSSVANALTILKNGRIALGAHSTMDELQAQIETVQVQGPILIQDYATLVGGDPVEATEGAIRYDGDFKGYKNATEGWVSLTSGGSSTPSGSATTLVSAHNNTEVAIAVTGRGASTLTTTITGTVTLAEAQGDISMGAFGVETTSVTHETFSLVEWGFFESGIHTVEWFLDGSDVFVGIYIWPEGAETDTIISITRDAATFTGEVVQLLSEDGENYDTLTVGPVVDGEIEFTLSLID